MQPELFGKLPLEELLANEVADLRLRLAALTKNVASLLVHAGDEGVCKGCSARIYWLQHHNGARAPYDIDGANHFAACPNREQFRRKKTNG